MSLTGNGEYLNSELFKPLGMKNTGVLNNASPPENMAIGYSYVDAKYEPALNWDMSWAGGAGALYSTVGDLHRWNEALRNGRVIRPESLKAATTPVTLPKAFRTVWSMAMARALQLIADFPSLTTRAASKDVEVRLALLPCAKTTVVVLTNVMPSPAEMDPQLNACTSAEEFGVHER